MAEGSGKSTKAIHKLLEEKDRIEEWLDRLRQAADETPAHVREKVEHDYQARLTAVMTELHGHRGELEATFERFSAERAQLSQEETAASERLAEAELRHSVGEYDEAKWKGLKTDILESLVKIRENLQGVEGEMAGLEGVLDLLRAPPDGTVPPAPADVTVEPIAPIPAPSSRAQPIPQTDAFDDSSMLRLETEDSQVPGAAAARGEFQTTADGSTPEQGRAPEPPQEEAGSAEPRLVGLDAPESVEPIQGDGSTPIDGSAKTLTCSECGTPNLPTEWYCERCGAELDAV